MKIRTLQTVLNQIEKLQEEADTLRKNERAGVITRIRDAVRIYEITEDEIFGIQPKYEPKPEVFKPRKSTYVFGATYTDGVHTWVARGHVPNWLKARGGDISRFKTEAPLVPHPNELKRQRQA